MLRATLPSVSSAHPLPSPRRSPSLASPPPVNDVQPKSNPQVFLIVAVVLLMPRAPTDHLDFSHHSHLPQSMNTLESHGIPQGVTRHNPPDAHEEDSGHSERSERSAHHHEAGEDSARRDDIPGVSAASAATGDGRKYAIVFDAGSTGSRVHVFRFDVGAAGELALVDDTFEQLKPGLSSFAKEPQKGAESLKPLLAVAMKTVPEGQRAETTVEVRATAGLRMLPGHEADDLLAAVKTLLAGYPFKFSDDSVTIMDGAEEGAFQWLTMNYLLGNLEGGLAGTVATVDLGGGSVQLAYAAEAKHVKTAPDGYFKEMKGGGATYHVYVYSHLGYGLMAARAAVLGKAEGGASPCVPTGHEGEYVYGGKTHAVKGDEKEPADAAACKAIVDEVLAPHAVCEVAEQRHCSFNGAWDGSRGPGAQNFYLSSYLFDRVSQAGLVDPNKPSGTTTPKAILGAAEKACALSPAEVQTTFDGVEEKDASYFCHDLSYAHSLLTVGYKLQDSKQVTMVKQVEYKGQKIEAAWPLGAAINALSSSS